jgi:NAD(P)-dependent dehydrogenase (short-subunit alcohol dehydrogenase family)
LPWGGLTDAQQRFQATKMSLHAAMVDRMDREIGRLLDQIEAMGQATPAIYPMHLEGATLHDFEELANAMQSNFGRLDGLLHNAANMPYLSRIKDYEPEDWRKVMQVNLNAPFYITQACLSLLDRSEDARVIFTTDEAGHVGKAFTGAYGVSKFGIEGLTRILGAELENTSIRVNCIDPGPTLTALRKRAYPGEDNASLKTPETLAPLYLWAMGPDSRGTTGQRLSWED